MEIGARLKSERLRLGLTQAKLGAVGGVTANAQGLYERGSRIPRADYLSAIAEVGVDVLYVITGKRAKNGEIKTAQVLLAAIEIPVKVNGLNH